MQLSKNFSLYELTKSETAIRLGLDNTPNQQVVQNLQILCDAILQPVRDYYNCGVKINSGYRSPQVNSAIGGSKTSDHCLGYAADFEIPGIPNAEIADFVANNFQFRQLILEFYQPGIPESGWVHVSYNPSDLKCQVLTAIKESGRTKYYPGIVV